MDSKVYGGSMTGIGILSQALENLQSIGTGKTSGTSSYADIQAAAMEKISRTDDMTMEEFKEYIWARIDSFPFSPTRPYDEETIKISDKCWERMKEDPEYEEKMMAQIRDGRMYPDPFFGMGTSGTYWVLEFDGGEGCWSHGFSKNFGGSDAGAAKRFERESEGGFWSNRRKRQKEIDEMETEHIRLMKMQQKYNNEKARIARLQAQGKYDEASDILSGGVPASFLLAALGA